MAQKTSEIRWAVLKNMLDTFPELVERTETYLLTRKIELRPDHIKNTDFKIQKLMKNAIKEYRKNTSIS
ncbi:MAG: hypothetical protein PVF96_06890 [Candidatus Bathyarchaeota archaeon]|jgi:hypothetical protein